MKKNIRIIILTSILIATLLLNGCSVSQKKQKNTSDKLTVVTTLFPYYDFLKQIGGEHIELTLLLPAGKDAHAFEPTPSDYITVQNADVFVYNGGTLEAWVPKVLNSIEADSLTSIAMMDNIKLLEEETPEGVFDDHDHDEHDHEYDEHIWTSVKNSKQIVTTLTEELVKADPKNKESYESNAAAYTKQLEALDEAFLETISHANKNMMVFGDKFPLAYFAKDYGLEYRAAFSGCSTHTDPSVKTVTYLINLIKKNEIPVVYYLELSSHSIADTLCEATGAKPLLFHSCHNVSAEDFKKGVTYIELMEQNIKNLKEGLK